jgi:hypothetical protein
MVVEVVLVVDVVLVVEVLVVLVEVEAVLVDVLVLVEELEGEVVVLVDTPGCGSTSLFGEFVATGPDGVVGKLGRTEVVANCDSSDSVDLAITVVTGVPGSTMVIDGCSGGQSDVLDWADA